MAKADTTTPKLTRWDKSNKSFLDRFEILKDGLVRNSDSVAKVQKQTLDSADEFYKTLSESQAAEISELYEIIKTSKDEARIKEARDRLKELDLVKKEAYDKYIELSQSEGDKAYKHHTAIALSLLIASGLFSNKQLRQLTGKAVTTVGKSLLQIKG